MTAMAVGEKRIIDDSLQRAQNVLVDVEGTTTSIRFLKVRNLGFLHEQRNGCGDTRIVYEQVFVFIP